MRNCSSLYYDEMNSPLGTLTLFSTEKGLSHVTFGSIEDIDAMMRSWARKYFLNIEFVKDSTKLENVIQQLEEYFQGVRSHFSVDVDLYGTPFQQKVWQVLLDNIPFGETRSYKDIAKAIQVPKAVRAIGGAVNRNPISIIVPCHRVIGSNGSLVGYNGGLDKKKHLLSLENPSAQYA